MEDQIYELPEKLITKPYSLSMLKFLKIISDDDVMEDQIYVLPERVWTMKEFLAWMPYEYSNFLIPKVEWTDIKKGKLANLFF